MESQEDIEKKKLIEFKEKIIACAQSNNKNELKNLSSHTFTSLLIHKEYMDKYEQFRPVTIIFLEFLDLKTEFSEYISSSYQLRCCLSKLSEFYSKKIVQYIVSHVGEFSRLFLSSYCLQDIMKLTHPFSHRFFQYILNTPEEFKRIFEYKEKINQLKITNQAFKHAVVEYVLKHEQVFTEFFKSYHYLSTLNIFSKSDAENIVNYILNVSKEFKRLFYHSFTLEILEKLPEFCFSQIIDYVLANANEFQRLITCISDLQYIKGLPETYTIKILNHILKCQKEFRRLFDTSVVLRNLIILPAVGIKLVLDYILTHPSEFRRLIGCTIDLMDLKALPEPYIIKIIDHILSHKVEFQRIFKYSIKLEHMKQLPDSCIRKTFTFILNNPDELQRIFKSNDSLEILSKFDETYSRSIILEIIQSPEKFKLLFRTSADFQVLNKFSNEVANLIRKHIYESHPELILDHILTDTSDILDPDFILTKSLISNEKLFNYIFSSEYQLLQFINFPKFTLDAGLALMQYIRLHKNITFFTSKNKNYLLQALYDIMPNRFKENPIYWDIHATSQQIALYRLQNNCNRLMAQMLLMTLLTCSDGSNRILSLPPEIWRDIIFFAYGVNISSSVIAELWNNLQVKKQQSAKDFSSIKIMANTMGGACFFTIKDKDVAYQFIFFKSFQMICIEYENKIIELKNTQQHKHPIFDHLIKKKFTKSSENKLKRYCDKAKFLYENNLTLFKNHTDFVKQVEFEESVKGTRLYRDCFR